MRFGKVMGAAAAVAALGIVSAAPAAKAQDRCMQYANEMVSLDQRARKMRCPGWNGHSNWDGHYQWCTTKTPQQTGAALDEWGGKFDGCATSYGGQGGGYKPPPPANAPKQDQSRVPVCKSFSQWFVTWRNKAIQLGCNVGLLAPGLSSSEPEAFNACMSSSDAEFRKRSPKALGIKGMLEQGCTGQLRRPFKL